MEKLNSVRPEILNEGHIDIEDVSEELFNFMSQSLNEILSSYALLCDDFNYEDAYHDFNFFLDSLKDICKDYAFKNKQLAMLKIKVPTTASLTFEKMKKKLGDPIYDRTCRCWLIIENIDNNRIYFSDGTSIDQNTPIDSRYYEKWMDFSEEEKANMISEKLSDLIELRITQILNGSLCKKDKVQQLEFLNEMVLTDEMITCFNRIELKKQINLCKKMLCGKEG